MSLKVRNRRATVLNSWWEYEPKPSRDLLSQSLPRHGLRICFATQIRSICKPRQQLAPRACREFYLDVAASWNVLSYSAKCTRGSFAFADSFKTTVRKEKKNNAPHSMTRNNHGKSATAIKKTNGRVSPRNYFHTHFARLRKNRCRKHPWLIIEQARENKSIALDDAG